MNENTVNYDRTY